MQKNVASQKWVVFAFDRTDNTPKTGDAAQITANIKVGAAASGATNDLNPTELEDGYYQFDLLQAETNADELIIFPASSTSNIQVIGCPSVIYTRPANFSTLSLGVGGAVTTVTNLTNAPTSGDLTAAMKASVNAEVDNALDTAIGTPTADSPNAYIQAIKYATINKVAITEANGNTTIYKDDDTTPYATVATAYSTDATTTTRKRLE